MPSSSTRSVLALAAGGMLLAGCSGSGTVSPPSSSSRTTATTTPSGSPLPTLPDLPSDLATSDPCGHAGSAFTAASIYLGLAQLGRTDEAQRCVRANAVARTTTAALRAPGVGAFYVPNGSTSGSTIRFVPGAGAGTAVSVTAAPAGDGYTVTAVRRG